MALFSHVMDEKTKGEAAEVICSWSQSWSVAKSGLTPGVLNPGALGLTVIPHVLSLMP